MNTALDVLLANLPMIVTVMTAIGLFKIGAGLTRMLAAKLKSLAAGTSNKVDDAVVDVVSLQLETLAGLLESGIIAEELKKLAEEKKKAKALK